MSRGWRHGLSSLLLFWRRVHLLRYEAHFFACATLTPGGSFDNYMLYCGPESGVLFIDQGPHVQSLLTHKKAA
jgi:hypothetical protein